MTEKDIELGREKELYIQVQEEKHHAVYKYECERDRNALLDKENEHLHRETQIGKAKLKQLDTEF